MFYTTKIKVGAENIVYNPREKKNVGNSKEKGPDVHQKGGVCVFFVEEERGELWGEIKMRVLG